MPASRTFTLWEGSPLIGSPIIYHVQPTDRSGVANLTFHRCILSVTVSRTGFSSKNYRFSIPVQNEGSEDVVTFDISSALRAYMDNWTLEVQKTGTQIYPVLDVSVETWDEYMSNGIIHTEYDKRTESVTRHYLLGAFTDRERMASGLTKGVSVLSRKPATGEIVPPSGIYVTPNAFAYSVNDWFAGTAIATPPSTTVINLGNKTTDTTFTTPDGRTVYVDGSNRIYTPIQFINGYGVLETAFALTLPEEKIHKKVKEYIINTPMSFNKINRHIARNTSSRHIFNMSSGFVTEAWQRWWQEEFLNTPQAWIFYDNDWLPCSIIPDDETEGIDLPEGNLPEVTFEVKLNIEGL